VSGGTRFDSGARLRSPADNATTATPPSAGVAPPAQNLPRPEARLLHTISVHSKTIYLRRERLQDDIQKAAMFRQLGLHFADYGQTAEIQVTVDRPVMTFDWTYALVYQPRTLTLSSGMIEAADEFDAGPKLAAVIVEQLAAALPLPRDVLDKSAAISAEGDTGIRRAENEPDQILRSARTIFVESHTIWMKGNLLQDALYVRPELRKWGIRIVDDRKEADIYIDVTRPFLTYDWVFQMIGSKTGTEIRKGRVTAIDGPAAAQRLAIDIVNQIRSVRRSTSIAPPA